MSDLTPEDRSNQATGHKANLSNPNTSAESKENSKRELENLGGEDAFYGKDPNSGASGNPGNVIGGHKATLSNPNVSEEAKQNSKEFLEKNT